MALLAKKPEVKKNRLKVFMYGNPKVGKSTLAIQFPRPYIIDTEGSMNKSKYVKLIEQSGGDVLETQDFEQLIEQVKDLLTLKHEYKTLVIDSLTILYNDLLDKYGQKVGTEFGRHYGEANKRVKHLLNLLLRLDMNVVITSHAKNEYSQNMAVVSQTFDCYKKLDYLFDLIFEIKKLGKNKRVICVKGTRLEEFEEDDFFPCDYQEISKRYDNTILEKESVAEKLATEKQVKELQYFLNLLKIDEEVVIKWLKKANATSLDEMSETVILKCIESLKTKMKGEAA